MTHKPETIRRLETRITALIAERDAARDDDFDERCRRASEAVVRDLLDATVGAAGVTTAVDDASRALLAVRDLERVADHAVNVAARTLYMVENDHELIY